MMDTPHTDATIWSALPDAIPAPTFKTAKRGFEREQVLQHVDRLNDRLRTLEHQVRQLRFETEQAKRERDAALRERATLLHERDGGAPAMSQPAREVDTYEHVSGRVSGLLTTLDKDIQTIRGEAEAEARQIVDQRQERGLPRAERVRRGSGHSDPGGPAGPRGSRAMCRRLGVSPQTTCSESFGASAASTSTFSRTWRHRSKGRTTPTRETARSRMPPCPTAPPPPSCSPT